MIHASTTDSKQFTIKQPIWYSTVDIVFTGISNQEKKEIEK